MTNTENSPASPCVRNCCLNDDDICLGCFRSLDEIREWTTVDQETRVLFLQRATERRDRHLKTSRLESIHFKNVPEN